MSQPPEPPQKFFTNSIGMKFIKIPGRDFYLGVTEVTQAQWQEVMGSNPSYFKGGDLPAEHVSWNSAQEFIRRLNTIEGADEYRLPTEAEWEYASLAGGSGKWCFGNDASQMGDYAWYNLNSGHNTHPVGQKKASSFGLYDIHGNVWEWCHDWRSTDRIYRVLRGGSWNSLPGAMECANRNEEFPRFMSNRIGFRLAKNP
jgi:formylglycine-generating enzyme required for sulfatase activity